MADITARSGKLDVSTDGVTYTDIGGIKDYDLSYDGGTIDVTDFDSAGWTELLAGIRSASISLTMNYDEADAGQDKIRTGNENGSILYWRIRPRGDGTGLQETIFQGIITGLSESGATDGAVECSVDVATTGAPTIQNQT